MMKMGIEFFVEHNEVRGWHQMWMQIIGAICST